MTLPTFLGIGAPKCGTTWLYQLLISHPDIYVPLHRKEVSFFAHHYDRGLSWYEKFFPTVPERNQYKAIGEITSGYLYCPSCPERIAGIPSITKLILILRNPIDRAYSSYKHNVQNWNYSGSVEEFWEYHPPAIQHGFYSRYLKDYFQYFNRDQILVLIFEQTVTDLSKTKETLAHFLEVPAESFPLSAGKRSINVSYRPKAQLAYASVAKLTKLLRYKSRFGWIADWYLSTGKKLRLERLFGDAGSLPPMTSKTRQYLSNIYENEIKELEMLLQIDLKFWK